MEKENYSMAICILKMVNGQVLGGRCFREACLSIQALLPPSLRSGNSAMDLEEVTLFYPFSGACPARSWLEKS